MEILIFPYETVGARLPERLVPELSAFCGGSVSAAPSRTGPREGYDPKRGQQASAAFLDDLSEARDLKAGPGGPILLGVTAVDLFVPRLSFVFGEADRRRRVAIVSCRRLSPEFYQEQPDEDLLALRLLKECIHEIGHVLGLDHCDDRACDMHFSTTVADTDVKGPGLCGRCRSLLASSRRHI